MRKLILVGILFFIGIRSYSMEWDSTMKDLYFREIKWEMPDSNFKFTFKINTRRRTISEDRYIDSIVLQNIPSLIVMNEYLKNNSFMIDKETVFFDNINSLFIRTKVLDMNYIIQTKNKDKMFGKMKSEWIIEDLYKDEVLKDTIYMKTEVEVKSEYSPIKLDHPVFMELMKKSFMKFIDNDTIKSVSKRGFYTDDLKQIDLAKAKKYAQTTSEAMKASVTIKIGDKHQSGFFINNEGYIITSYNRIAKDSAEIVLPNNDVFKAEVIRFNKYVDLALLKIDHENEFALNVDVNFDVGDDVFSVSTPKSIELGQSLSAGMVSGIREFNDLKIIQTDVPSSIGSNGGAIIKKSNSQLIGIIDYKVRGGSEGISLVLPSNVLKDYLKINYIDDVIETK